MRRKWLVSFGVRRPVAAFFFPSIEFGDDDRHLTYAICQCASDQKRKAMPSHRTPKLSLVNLRWQHIKGLDKLESVAILSPRITTQQLNDLKVEMPNVEIKP